MLTSSTSLRLILEAICHLTSSYEGWVKWFQASTGGLKTYAPWIRGTTVNVRADGAYLPWMHLRSVSAVKENEHMAKPHQNCLSHCKQLCLECTQPLNLLIKCTKQFPFMPWATEFGFWPLQSKEPTTALAGMAQRIECCLPANQRVSGSIPSLGHVPALWAWFPVGGKRKATTYWCFSPSLCPSPPLCLKINKIFFKKRTHYNR